MSEGEATQPEDPWSRVKYNLPSPVNKLEGEREPILTCDVCENVEYNTPNIKQHKKTHSSLRSIWLTFLTEINTRVYLLRVLVKIF